MAAKTPIRTVYTNAVATGLAEFQSGEFIDYAVGGTGLAALGSAGQVLKVNSGASALEYGNVEAVLNIDGMTDGSGITIVDADKFAISDGGTEKYVTASQISTYINAELGVDIDSYSDGTGITVAATDKLLVSDSGAEKKINASQLDTLISGSTGTLTNKTLTTPVIASLLQTSGSNTLTMPAATDTLVGKATTDTFTNKTFDLGGTGNSLTGSLAEFNSALQSESFVSLTGSETLTNKSLTAPTITGTAVMATLDISGDVDVDGTLETDALTIAGVTIAETIADTVGAMVGSNTETGIAVTYEDGDNTLDFALGAAQTTITSLLATDIKIGEDDQTKIDFETADEIHLYAANAEQVYVADGIFGPQTDSDVDLGTTGVRWKNAYIDTITTTGAITASGIVTGTGFTAGSAVLAEAELELLDGLTAGTAIASKVVTTDASIDTTGQRNLTITGELDAATGDFSGDVDVDGTLEADAITVDGTTLAEYISDTAGAMVGSNTETGITVTYQDGDNTIDFAVDAAQTAITSIYNSSLAIGYGSSHANINFGTDNQITFDIDGTGQIVLKDGQLHPTTDSDVDLGKSDKYFKDAYIDSITTTGNTTIGGNLTVTGDYTVNGDTTIIDTATLSVEDPLIVLASGNNAADSVDIGLYGLYDTSGSQDLYSGLFRDASDSGKWKLFKDNQAAPTTTVNTSGTGYATGTLVATLEGNVTGAVTGNADTATALATARTIGGTSFDGTANIAVALSATATALASGRTIASTGDVVWTSASFDGSGNVTGTAAIGSGVIVNADVNASAAIADTKLATISTAGKVDVGALEIDGATEMGAAIVDADLLIVDDGGAGTEKSMLASRIPTYVFTKVSGDATIASNGALTIAATSVENSMLADDAVGADELASDAVVNASVASGAAIAFSKMANLTTSRALVSDGSGDVSVATTTSTEIGYVNGVTSAIQTQMDTKATKAFSIAQAVALG